jgi:hypothetical protein
MIASWRIACQFVLFAVVVFASGCASSSGDAAQPAGSPQVQVVVPPIPRATVTVKLTEEERQARFADLRATSEYQEALKRSRACMEALGYVYEDDSHLYYKDGSYEDLTVQKQRSLTGNWLGYRLDREYCDDSSGATALAVAAGLPPDEYDPNFIEQSNRQGAALMKCMASKGWQIPEPVRLRNGLLIYDVAPLQSEADAKQSWDIDIKVCNLDLSGFQR